jgi:hypothetical protein
MANLDEAVLEDRGVGGFRVRGARLAQAAGAKKIGMSLWELPLARRPTPTTRT